MKKKRIIRKHSNNSDNVVYHCNDQHYLSIQGFYGSHSLLSP